MIENVYGNLSTQSPPALNGNILLKFYPHHECHFTALYRLVIELARYEI